MTERGKIDTGAVSEKEAGLLALGEQLNSEDDLRQDIAQGNLNTIMVLAAKLGVDLGDNPQSTITRAVDLYAQTFGEELW